MDMLSEAFLLRCSVLQAWVVGVAFSGVLVARDGGHRSRRTGLFGKNMSSLSLFFEVRRTQWRG